MKCKSGYAYNIGRAISTKGRAIKYIDQYK